MPFPTNPIRFCVALAWLLVCSLGSLWADEEAPGDGKAVGGLCIRLQLPAAAKEKKPAQQCEVILDNVGKGDLNVKLGFSLANGKSHHPAALRLLAISKGNKTRTLNYRMVGVAGRVDPLVVPLPAGSSYTLRFDFDQFADSETGEPLDLTAEDYRLAAELVGEAVTKEQTNRDIEGLALMPFWQGTIRSSEVRCPLPKKQSDK